MELEHNMDGELVRDWLTQIETLARELREVRDFQAVEKEAPLTLMRIIQLVHKVAYELGLKVIA